MKRLKYIILRLFGLYSEGKKTTIVWQEDIRTFNTTTVKTSRFIKAYKKQAKQYKKLISADLAEDQHLFLKGYL